jgi:hypothetical protein
MAIRLTHDGSKFPEPAEQCCFCFTPCRTWYAGKDVAVCEQCSTTHKVKDVPKKADWLAAVRARSPNRTPTIGDILNGHT